MNEQNLLQALKQSAAEQRAALRAYEAARAKLDESQRRYDGVLQRYYSHQASRGQP